MVDSIVLRFSRILLLLSFALGYFTSMAGNPKEQIDSLKNVLNKAKGSDALELMYDIAKLHLDTDGDDEDVKTKGYVKRLSAFPGESNYGKALAKMLEANIQSNNGKLDEALVTYNSALAILKKIPNRDVPENIKIARVYFFIADIYIRKYNVSKGVDYLLKTIKLAEKIGRENEIPFIAHMKKNGADPGKELSITEARDYIKKHRDDLEVRKLGSYGGQILGFIRSTNLRLGNLFKDVKDYPNAIIYLKRAQKLAEEMGAEEPTCRALQSLGVVFHEQKEYDSSIVYFTRARDLAEKSGNIRYMYMLSDDLGKSYTEKTDFINALEAYEYMNKLLEPLKDSSLANDKRYDFMKGDEGNLRQIYIEELSNVRLRMGRICMKADSLKVRGMEYYKSAIVMLEELNRELVNKPGSRMESIWESLGELYIRADQPKKGIEYINKALEYFIRDDDKGWILDCYELLYLAYEKSNDYKNANKFYKAYIGLKDTIFDQNNSTVMANFQKRLEVEARDSKIELLNKGKKAQAAEIEKQKFVRNAIIGGLCLVLVLAFVIARSLYNNKKKNKLITQQKQHIEEKSKEISDSINYAKRIQDAILPSDEFLSGLMSDSFIFYRPKDVVSGDFYQFFQAKNELIIVTADCTGHGVPGALMSMIGNEQLNKIIAERENTEPAKILDALHLGVRSALKQDRAEGETRDGMDVALYKLNPGSNTLEYSGANRPLWILKGDEVVEIKANKQSIGGLQTDKRTDFTNHTVKLEKGNCIYTFTDGFADQFGGEKGKKFMLKNFERLLLKMKDRSMTDQKTIINDAFIEWKGSHEQIDDVLIIGIRI